MRQQNKYLSIAGTLLYASSATADIYVLGGLGGSNTIASWNVNASAQYINAFAFTGDPTATVTLPYENNSSEGFTAGAGQAGLGFRIYFWNWLWAGLEASILKNSDTETLINNGAAHETYDFGEEANAVVDLESMSKVTLLDPDVNLDLKLAVKLNNPYSTFFIKVGAVFNSMEMETTTDYLFYNPGANGTDGPNFFTSTVSGDESQNVVGLHLGVGLEHLINRYMAVTFEYSFHDYGNISIDTVTSTTSVEGGSPRTPTVIEDGLQTKVSADMSKHSGLLGFIFYFGKQYQ